MGVEGSSESDSRAAGAGEGERWCSDVNADARGRVEGAERLVEGGSPFAADVGLTAMGFVAGLSPAGSGCSAGPGVSSTVECLPVVQGGMARNSSKVRKRGLQHFHPRSRVSVDEMVNWRVLGLPFCPS